MLDELEVEIFVQKEFQVSSERSKEVALTCLGYVVDGIGELTCEVIFLGMSHGQKGRIWCHLTMLDGSSCL